MVKTDYFGVQEITPKANRCSVFACPAIYGAIKSLSENCVVGTCPEIYESEEKENIYLIVGKQIDPTGAGLEKKVGEGEVLIEVPKEIIDNKEK